ncbi:MAG: protein kinase [Verrucomicrobiales bacterium]|nr:protein kinase [Verrucomicrobiales bacterium]MCP5527755.1 protein kinase [Verrucomicrobiales bacterium]
MNPDSKSRLRDLFLEAADMDDGPARAAFLDEACGDDLVLRQRVEALLNAEARAGGPPSAASSAVPVSGDPVAGSRIGPYKILEPIGEGGCGVVFRAEQEEPVRRQVALKIIKLGMDTRQVVARFEAERQALALMDHPNIARVLDAGATATGRPYFVMELVRGVPVTDYCDAERLPTRQRLELFMHVCHAVQHAHQKGIIHRDLKPSNVLVTEVDGRPVPKVIDFGIAKAVEGRLTDNTLFTAFEQLVGTPSYMSPEQASLATADLDTRTDIYSLGALLYQLLTGETPFDTRALLRAGLDEMRRTIAERLPARPSTRLTNMAPDQVRAIAQARASDPSKLTSLLAGDLDWIAMKCLEKERGRRYETANGLALDIQRHLRNEPIAAHPPSRLYEFRKTVQRHWMGFAATTAVMLALATGIVVASRQAARALRAEETQARLRGEAEAAHQHANRSLRSSLLNQARLATLSDTLGSRDVASRALREAAGIEPSAAMVDAAATVLALFQVRDLGVQMPAVPGRFRIAINPQVTRYAWYGGEQVEVVVHAYPGHQPVQRFAGNPGARWDSLVWLPDGERILAQAEDGGFELWNSTSGHVQWSIRLGRLDGSEGDYAGEFAVDAAGLRIAHNVADGKIALIAVGTGAQLGLLEPRALPTCLAFHPHRSWLAIGTKEGVEVIDYERHEEVARRNTDEVCRAVAWTPEGDRLAHVGSAYRLELWAVARDGFARVPGLGGSDVGLCLSRDGRWLASSDEQALLSIRHTQSTEPVLDGVSGYPVVFSSDGDRLYCVSGSEGVKAYALSPSPCFTELQVPFFADSSLPGVAISPDERGVAATSYNHGVFLWDLERGGLPAWVPLPKCSDASFNLSGTRLLTCSPRGIHLLNVEEGPGGLALGPPTLVQPCATSSSRRFTLTFSDPTEILVSASETNWALPRTDFSPARPLPSRDQETTALSPDGQWLAEASFHSQILLRNLQTGQTLPGLPTQGGLLAFSPDGRWLTSARNGHVEAWETSDWTRAWQRSTDTVNPSTGHCAFRPQGDLLATLGSVFDLILLRPSDGRELLRLRAPHPAPVSRFSFSDSGRVLVVSTEAGRIQLWRLDELQRQLLELGLDWTALTGMPDIAGSD